MHAPEAATLDLSAGNLHDGATLTSGSGDVNLRLARDTHANVRATTGSGDIHSDLPITTQGDVGQRHSLDGTLNAAAHPSGFLPAAAAYACKLCDGM